jgi:hypothetical protein
MHLNPLVTAEGSAWVETSAPLDDRALLHPWDQAHGAVTEPAAVGFESAGAVEYAEPDFEQQFPYEVAPPTNEAAAFEAFESCLPRPINTVWPNPGVEFGWHLKSEYSQLRDARDAAGDPGEGQRIRVGILDTGYDPGHASLPLHINYSLARNFSGDGPATNATDPGSSMPMTNPGHGTATLAILAGKNINRVGPPPFQDVLGGAPHVEIVPIRIANSVVHFRTSSMAKGIEYAANIGCQVVSISMGGVPTKLWAEAVNLAYVKGMCIFAAAGNRVGKSPPYDLVYPARFNRVVAVCGFTANRTPYELPGWHNNMQGCFGPESAMRHALCAYTPNIPWCQMGCGGLVQPDGAGTSAATPQCAAAAALWLQKHRPQHAEKWRIVEGIRHALFSSAERVPGYTLEYLGNGLLRARAALDIPFKTDLPQSPADSVSFPWLRTGGFLESTAAGASPREEMLETEALQLYLQTPSLRKIADEADPATESLDPKQRRDLIDRYRQLPAASQTLRRHCEAMLAGL